MAYKNFISGYCKNRGFVLNYIKMRKEIVTMPYIDIKTNEPVTEENSDKLKAKLGEAISVVAGKSE